jgi:hypothetical protein
MISPPVVMTWASTDGTKRTLIGFSAVPRSGAASTVVVVSGGGGCVVVAVSGAAAAVVVVVSSVLDEHAATTIANAMSNVMRLPRLLNWFIA